MTPFAETISTDCCAEHNIGFDARWADLRGNNQVVARCDDVEVQFSFLISVPFAAGNCGRPLAADGFNNPVFV